MLEPWLLRSHPSPVLLIIFASRMCPRKISRQSLRGYLVVRLGPYLHYVLDEWFEKQVKPLMRGKCRLVRFADDFVIVFQWKHDAQRVMAVLPKRFEKYGLTVHPEKTKLIDFNIPPLPENPFNAPFAGGINPCGTTILLRWNLRLFTKLFFEKSQKKLKFLARSVNFYPFQGLFSLA